MLQILALVDAFDFVASRDDVERSKPGPEIYLLVAAELETRAKWRRKIDSTTQSM